MLNGNFTFCPLNLNSTAAHDVCKLDLLNTNIAVNRIEIN